jgi:hypothetical protein
MGFALSALAGFIAGVLGTLTVAYLQREGYLLTESRYLLLEHKTVPSDLLRYVQPGTSVANMRETSTPESCVTGVLPDLQVRRVR